MLVSTRVQGYAASVPPVWVTTSPLADAEWEEPYLQTLLATSGSPPVGYSVATGALPPGLSIVADEIVGMVTPNPDAPIWVTGSGSLGSATQGGSFSTFVSATGADSYTVRSGLLPWGIILDTTTGLLSGNLSIIGGAEDSPGPAPTWSTAAGSLGTFNELAAVSVSIAATPATAPISYALLDGGLPWGLSINRETGAITGTTAEVGGSFTPEPPATIAWTTPASTNLGSFAVGASVSIAQTVTPVTGSFLVISGVMPWGLSMSRATGLISGTVGAANEPGLYTFTVLSAYLVDGSFGYRTYTITIT